MRPRSPLLPIIFIILLFGGFLIYYTKNNYIQPNDTGAPGMDISTDEIVGIDIEIIDKSGNKYKFSSWQPGIPTVLRSGNITISEVIVTLSISIDFDGNVAYAKVTGGKIRFHVLWGAINNDILVYDFGSSPIQINNPISGSPVTVKQWAFTSQSIESAAGPITHGSSLEFRVDVLSDIKLEIGFQDAAGNIIVQSKTSGAGISASLSLTYEAGVFRGFSISFGT